MADPVSPPKSNPSRPDSSGPPPPPHDWEVLSMSMSSSAFGTPSASVVCGCDACTGRDTGNGIPHSVSLPAALESGSSGPLKRTGSGFQASLVENLAVEDESELKRAQSDMPDSDKIVMETGVSGSGLPSRNWAESPFAGGSSDAGTGAAEIGVDRTSAVDPFKEGWKPQFGAAAGTIADRSQFEGFREYGPSEHLPLPIDYHEVICSIDEDTEPLVLQEGMCIPVDEVMAAEEILGERNLPLNLVDGGEVFTKKARKAQANGTWWKRQTSLWGGESGKSNAMWSVALAAAFLGIVIVGHRWQRERYQCQQLRLELSTKEEKLNDLMYQVNRLKEVIVGRRRVPVMRSSSFSRFGEY